MNKDGNTHDKATASLPSSFEISWGISPSRGSFIYDAMVRVSDWKTVRFCWNARKQWFHGRWSTSGHALYRGAFVWNCGYLCKISKKNTVPFAWNFDDTEKEPTVLPAAFPNLWVISNRNFSWLCDRYSRHTNLLKSLMPYGLHDRPSICQGSQAHGAFTWTWFSSNRCHYPRTGWDQESLWNW